MTEPRLGADILSFWPEDLQDLIRQVLDAREEDRLGDGHVTEIARQLVAGDGAGQLWTVGILSGQFYRWGGVAWERDEPRGRLLLPLEDEPPQTASGAFAGPPGVAHQGVVAPTVQEGAPEMEATRERLCPTCKTLLRQGARFCTRCGAEAHGG